MKKNIFIGFVLFILVFTFRSTTVFAQDSSEQAEDNRIKVYLNEPIGAGIPVFVVTRCFKKQQEGLLTCNEETAKLYPEACNKEGENGDPPRILYNKNVTECKHDDDGHLAPTRAECKRENSSYSFFNVYAPVWAVGLCPTDTTCTGSEENIKKLKVEMRITHPEKPTEGYKINADTTLAQKFADKGSIVILPQNTVETCDDFEYIPKTGKIIYENEEETDPFGAGNYNASCFLDRLEGKDKDAVKKECKTIRAGLVGELNEIGSCSFSCKRAERISGTSGTDLISRFISAVYRWASGIVGIIAVLIMVYSGIEISMSGSQSEKIEAAKKRIFLSIGGLALLFLSGLILYTINPNFFG